MDIDAAPLEEWCMGSEMPRAITAYGGGASVIQLSQMQGGNVDVGREDEAECDTTVVAHTIR